MTLVSMAVITLTSGCGSGSSTPSFPKFALNSNELSSSENTAQALETVLPTLKWPDATILHASGTEQSVSVSVLAGSLTQKQGAASVLERDGYLGGEVSALFSMLDSTSKQQTGGVGFVLIKLASPERAHDFYDWLDGSTTGSSLDGTSDSSFVVTGSAGNPAGDFDYAAGSYYVRGSVECKTSSGCNNLAQSIGIAAYDSMTSSAA